MVSNDKVDGVSLRNIGLFVFRYMKDFEGGRVLFI